MKLLQRTVAAFALLFATAAIVPAQDFSAPAQFMGGDWTLEDQAELYEDRAAGLALDIADARSAGLFEATPAPSILERLENGELRTARGLELVGINTTAGHRVSLAELATTTDREVSGIGGGYFRELPDGRMAWTLAVRSRGAAGLRLHLASASIPEGVALYFYSITAQGVEVHGPYTQLDMGAGRDLWTNAVFAEEAFLEAQTAPGVAAPRELLAGTRFVLAEVAHLGQRLVNPSQAVAMPNAVGEARGGCPDPPASDLMCLTTAACQDEISAWADYARAIGFMIFAVDGGQAICTGGLLNDTDTSGFIPYFLTANHCIENQDSATSLELYWDFRANQCGAMPPTLGSLARTTGATLLATRTADALNDFTLLRLNQAPPAGRFTLGWTTAKPTNGTPLYRLSHPAGRPLHYSKHNTQSSTYNCFNNQNTNYVISRQVVGATQGGSSGSPVFTEDGLVRGQLFGACGPGSCMICDDSQSDTVDGAFRETFPLVSSFLNPEVTTTCNTFDGVIQNLNATCWQTLAGYMTPTFGTTGGLTIRMAARPQGSIESGTFGGWETKEALTAPTAGTYRLRVNITRQNVSAGQNNPDVRIRVFDANNFLTNFMRSQAESGSNQLPGTVDCYFSSNGSTPLKISVEILGFLDSMPVGSGITITGMSLTRVGD